MTARMVEFAKFGLDGGFFGFDDWRRHWELLGKVTWHVASAVHKKWNKAIRKGSWRTKNTNLDQRRVVVEGNAE